MNTITLNPAIGLEERPFTVRFSEPGAADRAEIEQFISDVFHQAYGAKIKRFKPCLMSLRDQDNKLVAACGFRSAALGPLFLETYLDRPIEAVLSEHVGFPVERNDIVEIGNLSVAEPGMARYLITAINDQLYDTSNQWGVFTAVPMLRNAFLKLGMHPETLGIADKNRLPPEEQAEWGSYYAQNPKIMAVQRIERRNKPRTSETGAPAATSARCQTCGMILRKE
ncbi:MAG: thermostable hemolysin [Gallionella sp.]|nr:thermostable hemolysin [Gallionella sp.]